MINKLKMHPIVRAVGVFGAVAAIATGATFAALNTTATLTDNEISTTTADLRLWNGTGWSQEAPGFHVDNFVPGSAPDNPFYFQNLSASAMNITAHVPVAPVEPAGGYGFTGWENLKVTFTSDKTGCIDPTVNTDMGALLAGDVALPCNPLSGGATGDGGTPNTEGNYKVKFDIDPAAVNGTHAGAGSFNVVFTGTQVVAD